MKKYKALRNECNRLIRQEATTATAERIVKSGNPSSVWQEVRNILNPKSSKKISLKIDGVETSEDERVADLFNKYFIAKIEKLRNDIDPKYIESPTKRLKKSLNERRPGTLQLRTVKEAEVIKALHDLKPKKSSGMDGVSQELLKSISSVVFVPLTLIINTSINTGVFPSPWKKSKITPISKGGDTTDPKNYRPVTCVPTASKVLESVIERQVRNYFEKNHLFPNQQHGFRQLRSTTMVLTSLIAEWKKIYEAGLHTGVLFWDLTSTSRV